MTYKLFDGDCLLAFSDNEPEVHIVWSYDSGKREGHMLCKKPLLGNFRIRLGEKHETTCDECSLLLKDRDVIEKET